MPALGEVFAMRNAANPEPLFCPDSSVGSGWSNSKILEAAGIKNFDAVNACLNYGNGTSYDDWFLPSKDEFALIYTNIVANQVIPFTVKALFSNGNEYWTSSAYAQGYAYYGTFSSSTLSTNRPRTYSGMSVRAIRAF